MAEYATQPHANHEGTPHKPSKVRIAVFDFDGTLVTAQSGKQFALYLLKHKLISFRKFLSVTFWGIRYSIHLPATQRSAAENLTSGLDGLPMDRVLDIMRDFHQERMSKYYVQDALDEIKKLKTQGYVCVLVSATFRGVAKTAAEHSGVDAYIGTKMVKSPDDRFIAEVDGDVVVGQEKLIAFNDWANEQYGAGNWVLEYAFGDHYTDESILRAAVHPVAVNPSPVLEKKAKQYGWTIAHWK